MLIFSISLRKNTSIFVVLLLAGLSVIPATASAPTLTISAKAAITDGVNSFTTLDGAIGITTVVIGGNTLCACCSKC